MVGVIGLLGDVLSPLVEHRKLLGLCFVLAVSLITVLATVEDCVWLLHMASGLPTIR